MPMMEGDEPDAEELPSTLQRSPETAQRTFAKAHDSAVETYGEGERAHRTAFAALKHSFEKVGDHWEPKDEKGPSDPQAARSAPESADAPRKTAGGVDVVGNSKQDLYERAKELDIPGRSKMSKEELGQALNSENQKATARARRKD